MSEHETGVLVKLPRVTTYRASIEIPISAGFYHWALPIVTRLNMAFDIVMLTLVAVLLVLVFWIAFGIQHDDPYVSDGVVGCQPRAVVLQERTGPR